MAYIPANIERLLGGGKLYYQDGNDWKEFGEVSEFKYSITVETTDAMNHDNCMEEIADTAVTKWEGKVGFTTQNMSNKNFALSSLGVDEDITINAGDELPDGTTAAASTVVRVVKAGKKLLNKEALKYVAAKCDGKRRLVVEFPSTMVTPSGEKTPQTKEFAKIGFEGKILAPADGSPIYTEYLIPAS